MYSVKYIDGEFWIIKDGEIVRDLGSFIDPITPEIIIEVIKDEEK